MSITFGSRAPALLVVDDEMAILTLLQRRLEMLGCEVSVLPGGTDVVETVRASQPDLILLDVMMPDLDGFSVVKALKSDAEVKDIPVILMTAKSETESRIEGLDLGAHDYVSKPFNTAELVARIRAALRVKQLQDELKEVNRRLARLATSDPLTDLPNRRTFDEGFFIEMERSRRSGEPLSVLMFDLDRFKRINDTYGHQVGDDALRLIGGVLLGRRRVTDLIARYGGEEFVWALPGAASDNAVELAEWLRGAVSELQIETPQGTVSMTVSVGVTTYHPSEHGPISASGALEVADQALRQAKAAGRNRVTFQGLVGDVGGADTEAVTAGDDSREPVEDEETPGFTRYR